MENKQTADFEKDIVSSEQAIELATIGFDKQTQCGYDITDMRLYLCNHDEDGIYMPQKDLAAPTKSQVFRWFREKYKLSVYVTDRLDCVHETEEWKCVIDDMFYPLLSFETYEEAENACINELIEIAKQQAMP